MPSVNSLRRICYLLFISCQLSVFSGYCAAQTVISGTVASAQAPLAYAQVTIPAQKAGVLTNTEGAFQLRVMQFPATPWT